MSTLARLGAVVGIRFTRPATLQVSRAPGAELPAGLGRLRDGVLVIGLKQLLQGRRFDMCQLRSLLEAARIIPDGDVMRLLAPLHCVEWADMPVDTRQEVAGVVVAMFDVDDGPAAAAVAP